MDERKVQYTNGFRVAIGALEAQILFNMETPVVDEESGQIIGTDTQNVVDLRLNPVLAKQLCDALQVQINEYEKAFGTLVVPGN